MAQPRTRGVLKVRRRSATAVLKRAKLMRKGLSDHAAKFTDPDPDLSVFADQIALTDEAQVAAIHGGKGAAAARDVEVGILYGMMESELLYIQMEADTGNLEEAIATLLLGGVEIAGDTSHEKDVLTVRQGPASGSVVLDANAGALAGRRNRRNRFFSWQYTLDGTTFVTLPSTPNAKTTVTGLTPLTVVGFRVCVTTSADEGGPWSQIVNFLVH